MVGSSDFSNSLLEIHDNCLSVTIIFKPCAFIQLYLKNNITYFFKAEYPLYFYANLFCHLPPSQIKD